MQNGKKLQNLPIMHTKVHRQRLMPCASLYTQKQQQQQKYDAEEKNNKVNKQTLQVKFMAH